MNTAPALQESNIEERLVELEKQMAAILQKKSAHKDWEKSMGMWTDDELSREVDRLGRDWRQSVTD